MYDRDNWENWEIKAMLKYLFIAKCNGSVQIEEWQSILLFILFISISKKQKPRQLLEKDSSLMVKELPDVEVL